MSDVFYEDFQIHSEVGGPELKSDTNSESENDEFGSDKEDEYEDEDLQGYVDFPNDRRKTGLSRLLEVFPDVDSGFLQDKNVEFDGDLSKINDWIQHVFEKDLAGDFPPKVSEEFLEKVNYLMEIFPNMPKDYIKDKVKDLMGKPNLIQRFVEDVLQTDFKKNFDRNFVNISEFLQYRQTDAEEGRKIVDCEKLLQVQKNCGIEGLEICPFCAFAYIPPKSIVNIAELRDRTFYCQNGPSCGRTSCRICKKEKPDSCGCNPSLQSNTQWEWQQRLILEDSVTQNEKTLPENVCDKLMHTQMCCPSKATSIWGNPNLSSLYEFSDCGTRIVCQKCKVDMNEIFKSSKKHACETELVKETEEGAVGGQGTMASNTKGNDYQFKLRCPRLILPPSPVASEKEEFEPTTEVNETNQEVTGDQAIASPSDLKTPDEFDSLIDRLSESLGVDSSAEFFDEAKRQEFFDELSDEEEFFDALSSAPSNSKSEAASYQARKKPLDLIFDGVMAIYPELDCMQLYSILRKIKEENNNTLKDLSMIQILDQVAELKAQKSIETNKNTVQSAQESENDPLEVSAPLSAPAPETGPAVLLGATPKFQLATQDKGNNKEKMDGSTPKKEVCDEAKRQQIFAKLSDELEFFEASSSAPSASQKSENVLSEVSAPLSTPATKLAPVLLGATPKFQLATQEKGNIKEKLDDSTPKKAQESLEVGKNNAQILENDPLVFPPTTLPTSAPKTSPVLGAKPKIKSVIQGKGNNKQKMDDFTLKKAQGSLEVGKNNAEISENDPLVFPPTTLPTPAPKTSPVLGAKPKIKSVFQEKGNNKQKMDDYTLKKAQESLEVGKNNAQISENDPFVLPPTLLPTSSPETAPVFLGATPKIQSATQEKGNNKQKMDDCTSKKVTSDGSTKVHKFLKSEAKDEKPTNIKFSFKVKFDSDQAALNMKKAINKALTGVKANTDSNEN